MSDTPRTDAEVDNTVVFEKAGAYIHADFARELERENAKLREALVALEKACCDRLPHEHFLKLTDEIVVARLALQDR